MTTLTSVKPAVWHKPRFEGTTPAPMENRWLKLTNTVTSALILSRC